MVAVKSFLYIHCLDLDEMRAFYTDVLGLGEIYFSETERSVGYLVGTLQLTIGEHHDAEVSAGWASQMGWAGGTTAAPSWGVELPPAKFRSAVDAVATFGSETFFQTPSWVGYWSLPVRDPMGNTVEITNPDRSTLSEA